MSAYGSPCPDCGLTFSCEFGMQWHFTMEHLPQPRGFIDLALVRSVASEPHSPSTTPADGGRGVRISTTDSPAPRHGGLSFARTGFVGGV